MNKSILKILIPLDFSDCALNTLQTAIAFAISQPCNITILHVRDNMLAFAGINLASSNSIEKNATPILAALEGEVYQATGRMPEMIETDGIPIQIILQVALESRADIIVMGTHGASGTRPGYLGSTSAGVLKYAPVPVLLIPEEKKWPSFKNVLFPVRPIPTALRHYPLLRRLMKEGTLEILGLQLPGDGEDASIYGELNDEITAYERGDKSVNVSFSSTRFMPAHILQHAYKKKSDLIVMAPFIDVSSKQFYTGPNMHYIINHSRIPILVINKMHYPVEKELALSVKK